MASASDPDKSGKEDATGLPGPSSAQLHKLGRYEIVSELGRGGMGVVYLARDPKIGRSVAIKTISTSEIRQADDEAYQRLCREAHSAGVLSHPGIVTVYELEEDGDTTYIVMEYVTGCTLRDYMARPGSLSQERVLDILEQAAAALDFAHSKGIVHRDVKPANIMIEDQGFVKIADFGVAKIVGAVTQSKTTSSVGTPYYMSPEQIRLEEVGGRSDQFSLAVVSYELFTGKRPFSGDSLPSLIHQILNVEPMRADQVKASLGPVGNVLAKALSKEAENRYASCSDFVAALRKAAGGEIEQSLERTVIAPAAPRVHAGAAPSAKLESNAARLRTGPSRWRTPILAGSAFVLAVAAVVGSVYWRRYQALNAPPQFTFTRLAHQAGMIELPSLSPDGKRISYASNADGDWDIYTQAIRPDDSLNPQSRNLTHSNPSSDVEPAFSPDGKWIAFRSEQKNGGIFVINSQGGVHRQVTDFGYNPTWSPDGARVCFATESVLRPEDRSTTNSKLWAVDINTGERTLIYDGDAVQPSWSPHGQRIAFWFVHDGGIRDIATVPAQGGAPVLVTNDPAVDWNPVWSPDGRYLYFASDRSGQMGLWRVRIDEASGKRLSKLQPLGEPGEDTGYVSLSGDGKRLTYVERDFAASINRVQFDPVAEKVIGKPAPITQGKLATRPDVSADGKWVAFSSGGGKQEDIYLMDSEGNNYQSLTNDPSKDRGPRWSADGEHLAFFSNRHDGWQVWVADRDGKNLRQVSKRGGAVYPVWSPKEDSLIYTIQGAPAEVQSFIVKLGPKLQPESMNSLPLRRDPQESFTPWSWSPDSKLLAGYQQREDGSVSGITVFNFETGEYRRLTDFGSDPVWLHKSARLLFYHDGKLYIADLHNREKPREVLSLAPYDIARRGFAVTGDDRLIYFSLEEVQSEIWMGKLN